MSCTGASFSKPFNMSGVHKVLQKPEHLTTLLSVLHIRGNFALHFASHLNKREALYVLYTETKTALKMQMHHAAAVPTCDAVGSP